MDESTRESIALFRYGLIAPILNGQVKSQKEYLAQIATIKHDVPHYGLKEFSPKTIEFWVRYYRRYGFDGLKPKGRSDKGSSRKIPAELSEKIILKRKESLGLSVTLFYESLVKEGLFYPHNISYTTVYRFLKKENLVEHTESITNERKRFSYDKVNQLWQGDTLYGPYIKVGGKKVGTYLLAFIDDASRLVPFGQFFLAENINSLKTVFKESILRRGIPKLVYVDNGKIFQSGDFSLACASLGITLIHTKPYDPAAKGKIERFFGTVRTRFLPTLDKEANFSLEDLNISFWKWLEEDYHRRNHTGINMPPLDFFISQFSEVKMCANPKILDEVFLKRVVRKVKHDATISLNSILYEVPFKYIGEKLDIRYSEDNLDEIFIYLDGKRIDSGKKVSFSDNTKIKRAKNIKDPSPLAFKEINKGREN
ncbi:Transposase InsO and inactivated derivatives [Desulfonispora thiosulfatigenes DSM 11270]|uniref:Transposase InsO and inactivated derivatives n=1 Tax=Desulfonispora thiosulfatigenes DSM 11270 TaxID=656914 RepID=A0A1W1UNM8_DESTI|nr:DDE-type integrase/transposase/recombinase [Desulfonispora thiosulfatigenes]SMB82712.1 Transposase InsO and inactivated derivatives [Desulfonispora thiosulfatigenes DSM 11270]